MKIGLCVRYDCNNYGSMLQILATQKLIQDLGHDYEIIRYNKNTPLFFIRNITRIANPYFMKGKIVSYVRNKKISRYPSIKEGNTNRIACISHYRNNYIGPFSPIYKGYSNLVHGANNYDAILVGSDQLWTPAGIKSRFYNLLFVPDEIKKISYATSFGVSEIPVSQKKLTKKFLNRIEFLSVREIRGAEIIKELTQRSATIALDPTLMYSKNQWDSFLPNDQIIKSPYIFAFFLGDNNLHREAVEQLKKSTGLKVVTIPFMETVVERDFSFGDEQLYNVGPVEFLNLIRGADYVCTDSFHGTVFSLLYHKKFITFNRTANDDKQTRNSRIDSLFELLSLQDRRYREGISLTDQIQLDINYTDIEHTLEELRNISWDFLQNAINS